MILLIMSSTNIFGLAKIAGPSTARHLNLHFTLKMHSHLNLHFHEHTKTFFTYYNFDNKKVHFVTKILIVVVL
jgi:hypothetical protein